MIGRGDERPVKDKVGHTISDAEKQKVRWAEHFSEILNRPPPEEIVDFSVLEKMEPFPIIEGVIDIEEVKIALESLKNYKAAGEDKITAEMLKAADADILEYWLEPYNTIWTQEEIPKDWQNGIIIKIPKKGDLSDCNNWRDITLLSVPGKVFCRIILQ